MERLVAVTDAFKTIPRNWHLVAGLALTYAWTWLLYWGGPFSLRTHTIELANTRWAAHVIVCALTMGVIVFCAARSTRARSLMAGIRWAGLVGALVGSGTAVWLVLAPPSSMQLFLVAAFVSGIFTGLGEGCLLCLWCTITASLGMRVALAYNVIAMAMSGLLFLGCNAMPTLLGLLAGTLCPLASLACSARTGACTTAFLEKPSDAGASRHGRGRLAPLLADRSFTMLMAIALVFGVSCGFVLASFEVVPKATYWTACYGVVIGTILAAALGFVTAFVLKMDAWQLVFQTSLPLMGAAYLLFPYELFGIVGPGLHTLGYQYFFVTFWSLLGSKQLRHDVPAACSVSLGLFVTNAGQALGLGLWNLLCSGVSIERLRIASSVAAFILIVVAVTFEHPVFGWGNVRPGETHGTSGSNPALPYEAIIARIQADYSLSPRERDVALLLGRGRNRQFVADELGISLETAKTHATNVYRKLGVHSQQELLDVIEMTQDTLTRERA